MSIGDSITLVSCLGGLLLALPGLMIALNMFFNGMTTRAVTRLSRHNRIAFFVGLLTLIVVGYSASALMAVGSIFQFIGSILMLLVLTWMFTGLGVIARYIGIRLAHNSQLNSSAARETAIGAFALTLAIAFPLVGWFVVLPLSWILGSGALVMALFNRQEISGDDRSAPVAIPTPVPEFAVGK